MNELLTLHIRQTADLLATHRVSQDGWAKVLERTVTDLQSGKIVAHVPTHLKAQAGLAAIGGCASSELIRSSIAQSA